MLVSASIEIQGGWLMEIRSAAAFARKIVSKARTGALACALGAAPFAAGTALAQQKSETLPPAVAAADSLPDAPGAERENERYKIRFESPELEFERHEIELSTPSIEF